MLVSNRGRVDLRFIDGEYSWRFRSRLSVEKEFSIGRVRMNPYVRGELYYDSRFDAWSRTEWVGGAAFPLNRRIEREGYFCYQHDTGGESQQKGVRHRIRAEPVLLNQRESVRCALPFP